MPYMLHSKHSMITVNNYKSHSCAVFQLHPWPAAAVLGAPLPHLRGLGWSAAGMHGRAFQPPASTPEQSQQVGPEALSSPSSGAQRPQHARHPCPTQGITAQVRAEGGGRRSARHMYDLGVCMNMHEVRAPVQ